MTIRDDLIALMGIPGLSGHEERVAAWLRNRLTALGIASRTDRLGNLIATLPGDPDLPSVMVFAHMDQLGFVVRKIEADGLIRVERLGGVSERAMAAQAVLLCPPGHPDVPGVIMNKAHHATTPDEKYKVLTTPEIRIDTGHGSRAGVEAAGIRIGTPVIYHPRVLPMAGNRLAGSAIDDRAGCAILIAMAEALSARRIGPTVHLVWSVLEEFNLRGAVVAAQVLAPDIAIQIDLILATDTPDMAHRGEVTLGGGPAMSLYSFHGRGTLNGTLPHPALVSLFEQTARKHGLPLQRSAHIGALTETSYVQLAHDGVAVIDAGFPCRYSHSAMEVCDLADLSALALLLEKATGAMDSGFSLDRDDYPS